MPEHVLGLTVNEVMAYAAIANVVLVLLLAAITTYYAWHAKRQADASHQEVAASKRQADIAQQTLDFLLRQTEQQRRIDLSAVSFNLEAAIHMVDQWQTRIRSDSYPQLPDVIELRPTNFSSSVAIDSRSTPPERVYERLQKPSNSESHYEETARQPAYNDSRNSLPKRSPLCGLLMACMLARFEHRTSPRKWCDRISKSCPRARGEHLGLSNLSETTSLCCPTFR